MADTYTVEFVEAAELHRLYAEQKLGALIADKSLTGRCLKDAHPTKPKAPVPFCTRSQTIEYRDSFNKVRAICHQYLLPDGSLGASGQPDPKEIRVANKAYVLKPK